MSKNTNVFSASRSRADLAQQMEENENEAYARTHKLHALFSEFAAALKEKDPSSEQEAEHILLDLLSHRKAERDRAALRLLYQHSFEISLDNGRKTLKLVLGQDGGTITAFVKSKVEINHSFPVTIEQVEELNERFYDLGRFIVEGSKSGGESRGFVRVDDGEVFLLSSSKECTEIGDELFYFSMFLGSKNSIRADEIPVEA